MTGAIEESLRDEAAGDNDFGRGGGGKGAKEVVIFGADGGCGVAVGDFVGWVTGLLVGELGGVVAIVATRMRSMPSRMRSQGRACRW